MISFLFWQLCQLLAAMFLMTGMMLVTLVLLTREPRHTVHTWHELPTDSDYTDVD